MPWDGKGVALVETLSNQALLILGAGQFGQMVSEIAQQMRCFTKIDFLDDAAPFAVGTLSDVDRYAGRYSHAIVAIGHPTLRAQWLDRLQTAGYALASVVSPSAFVAPSAKLGQGCIVEPMATVQSNASVGRGTIVSSGAVIRHNAVVGDFCHCDCNCVVLSCAVVPQNTKIPCGEVCSAR